MPQTPFERTLAQLAEQARRDPVGAYGRIEDAFNKSLTEADVQQLVTFATSLGGSLARFAETVEFLDRMAGHSALGDRSPVVPSIRRAQAVMHRCAGDQEAAEKAVGEGVTSPSDACRLEIMTAQTLASCGRPSQALAYLDQARARLGEVGDDEELLGQVSLIGLNLLRLAEQQTLAARAMLLGASETALAAGRRAGAWQARHQARYQRARALVLAGRPKQALDQVQEMLALEAENDAGPVERFFSAAVACQAQVLRGQLRIAAGARDACRDFAAEIEEERLREQVGETLGELDRLLQDAGGG